MLSYGGGLVSNDQINLFVTIEDGAKLCLLTQGSTKIFKRKSPEHLTTQTLNCTLHPNSALLLLPDPIQPFASAAYKQTQKFHLPPDDSASLIVLDWVTEGRTALNEHWDMISFISKNEFYIPRGGDGADRLLLRDSLVLESPSPTLLKYRMDKNTVFATLIIHGPKFSRLSNIITKVFHSEPRIGGRNFDHNKSFKHDVGKKGDVIWTATESRGFLLVKVTGKALESVKEFLRTLLDGENGENTVVDEFGESAFLCLQ